VVGAVTVLDAIMEGVCRVAPLRYADPRAMMALRGDTLRGTHAALGTPPAQAREGWRGASCRGHDPCAPQP